MSIRIATTSRLAAWLEARATEHVTAAYMRAEDALSIERHTVRTLQSQMADRAETIAHLHDEVGELQEEVRVLHLALKRTESKRDELAGRAAGSMVAEAEAFLGHPSQEGEGS